MRLVGSEVVPVVFEVDPFPPLYQGFRSGAVESEMPNAGIVVDLFPADDSRKESIHDNKFLCLSRILRRIGIGDHQSDIVTDDSCLLHAQGPDERMNANRGVLHVESVFGDTGVPDAGQIWRDHGKFRCKERNDWSPHARCLGVAMQQDHGRAMSLLQVVQFESIDYGVVGRDPASARGWSVRCRCRCFCKDEENKQKCYTEMEGVRAFHCDCSHRLSIDLRMRHVCSPGNRL